MSRPTHSCVPLAAALKRGNGVAEVSADVLNLLAIRIEEAIVDPRDTPVADLRAQLVEGLRDGLAKAPAEVVDAIRDGDIRNPHRIAYLLGQLGMAQTIAAQAIDRRCGEEFTETLAKEGYAPYIEALLGGSLSNSDLAKITGERLETVSRKLARLREIGAADFRRDGQAVHNFLTPAAEAVGRANARSVPVLPRPRATLDDMLTTALDKLPAHWSAAQTFSTDGVFSDITS